MRIRGGAAWPLALLAGACVTPQTVTLLPGEPGHDVGALAVLNADGSERGELTSANSRADLRARRATARIVPEAIVARSYGALIADLPPPPEHFLLRFDIGEARPAADQEAVLQRLFAAAQARPGAEVQVIGHTDTLDTSEVNDRLSRRRAQEVRTYLIARGLDPDQVRATWRGERELLVQTPDGVANEANRRVEVIVR